MDKKINERYESLKKSVNGAIKLLCNKVKDIKIEVRELKAEKANDKKNPCKACKCTKAYENMEITVKRIEGKLEDVIKKESTFGSDIERLREFQREPSEKIKVIVNKISVLEDNETELKDMLDKKNEKIF